MANPLLAKFLQTLKHADLPKGWQDNPDIVEEAGRLYREMGTESPFFKAYEGVRGKTEKAYHGTSANFDVFDVDKMGAQGTSQGMGIYTSPSEDFARGYGENVMPLFVATEKSFTPENKKLSKSTIRNILLDSAKADAKVYGEDISDSFLSNYGDIRHEGLDRVLRNFTESVMDNRNPIEQINDIIASGANYSSVMDSVAKRTGKTGYIPPSEFERVSFLPQNIKSIFNRGTFDPNDPNILRQVMPYIAGGGAATAALAPEQAQASIPQQQPINNMGTWEDLLKQGRVTPQKPVEEAVWSPADLLAAPVGAIGVPAKAAAMALDAPMTFAADYGANKLGSVLDWIQKRGPQNVGAYF